MDANGWAVIIAAIGVIVVQVTGMILSYLRDTTKMEKLNVIDQHIGHNTELTEKGTTEAATNARIAATTAADAKSAAEGARAAAESTTSRLNGELDGKIHTVVKYHLEPVVEMFKGHILQYDKNMKEIRDALNALRKT